MKKSRLSRSQFAGIVYLFLSLLASWLPATASAKAIIGDMSEYHVNIDSTFTGKHIILFGAQNTPGDVYVVVRGPERNVTIRKKKKVMGGMWINGKPITFLNVPFYYSISGSRPLPQENLPSLYPALEIGQNQLVLNTPRPIKTSEREEFTKAFLELQQQKGLYRNFSESLKFMGDTLFKTLITFPDTLPRGDYAVDMYLIEDGRLRGMQTLPVRVNKVGFDAFLYDLAHQHSVLYALLALGIALSVGWVISQLFSRMI
jgi:uncharacterized protein (TIGR02186 family)